MTTYQMVQYQRSNPYISTVSDQQLLDVIDPTRTINDYYYSNHPQYRHGIYQFADLRAYTGMTAAQLDEMIRYYAPAASNLFGMGYAFVAAAQTYNINESYLLAHCALESGWGTSTLAKNISYDGSEIDGVRYPAGTYHNFFGIGAVDSSPYSGGASYAIRNGWNTIEKAISGGAKWIAEGYIYRNIYNPPHAQPTLYAMKWDYNRSNTDRAYGWHQYATDHLWARKIARLMGDFYDRTGYKPELTYIIPQYAN
jgi:mannosyl-glycoprotein endo-beta-N-acetylglucosaminidase